MNILCVGDDTESLELTTVFLERKLPSVTIHTTESVTDAKALLETEPIVCVVSDYDMPDQNGLEFLQTVRETHSDLPFILFTGKGSEEIASEAISAGVTDYLQKRGPEQYDRLAKRIRHAVSEYQTEHKLRERVKELTAIQTISDLLADNNGELAEQLQQVVTYLPHSLQSPETAVASLSIRTMVRWGCQIYLRPTGSLGDWPRSSSTNRTPSVVGLPSVLPPRHWGVGSAVDSTHPVDGNR